MMCTDFDYVVYGLSNVFVSHTPRGHFCSVTVQEISRPCIKTQICWGQQPYASRCVCQYLYSQTGGKDKLTALCTTSDNFGSCQSAMLVNCVHQRDFGRLHAIFGPLRGMDSIKCPINIHFPHQRDRNKTMLMHILCICRAQADARVSSEIRSVFMNIQSSEVGRCPEGE